uniref:Uncharacterized protein n=1 Tax=Schistosoma japonicum TaxID=6182 RepID=C1LP98_SCHJA|nr:hypothetical protein [Schistosoma japonicum]
MKRTTTTTRTTMTLMGSGVIPPGINICMLLSIVFVVMFPLIVESGGIYKPEIARNEKGEPILSWYHPILIFFGIMEDPRKIQQTVNVKVSLR